MIQMVCGMLICGELPQLHVFYKSSSYPTRCNNVPAIIGLHHKVPHTLLPVHVIHGKTCV